MRKLKKKKRKIRLGSDEPRAKGSPKAKLCKSPLSPGGDPGQKKITELGPVSTKKGRKKWKKNHKRKDKASLAQHTRAKSNSKYPQNAPHEKVVP